MGMKPKKMIAPTITGLLFAAPGVVTLGFALNEADRWQSDWVMISGALFGVAGLCILIGFTKAFKAVGALVALALIAGGGAWVYTQLNAQIQQRQAHYKNYDALRKAQEELVKICQVPKFYDKAAAYDPNKKGIHPTYVFNFPPSHTDNPADARAPSDPEREGLFADWQPKKAEEIELVACIKASMRQIESCQYMGGTLYRKQEVFDITVIDLHAGNVIHTDQVLGGVPEACKDVENFYSDSATSTKIGIPPQKTEFADRLKPVIHVQ